MIPAESIDKFIDRIAAGDSVSNACRASNVGRRTVYDLRSRDDGFAARWDEAIESGTDAIEQKAVDLALDGDRSLIMFLLRGRRRGTYGDKVQVDAKVEAVPVDEVVALRNAAERDPEAFARVAKLLGGTSE